jgi:hypothetical protein
MNNLLIIKKSLALSMTILLTLATLLSVVGSARAQENSVAPGRHVLTAPSQTLGPTDPAPLFGVSMIYKIVLGLGVLSAALTVGALGYTALAWKNSYWGVASRVYYTLATIAAVAFVWFLNYWNLLGWRY